MSRKNVLINATILDTTGSAAGRWTDITYLDNLASIITYTGANGVVSFDVALGDPRAHAVPTASLNFGAPINTNGTGEHTVVANQLPYNFIRARFIGTGVVSVHATLKSVGA